MLILSIYRVGIASFISPKKHGFDWEMPTRLSCIMLGNRHVGEIKLTYASSVGDICWFTLTTQQTGYDHGSSSFSYILTMSLWTYSSVWNIDTNDWKLPVGNAWRGGMHASLLWNTSTENCLYSFKDRYGPCITTYVSKGHTLSQKSMKLKTT